MTVSGPGMTLTLLTDVSYVTQSQNLHLTWPVHALHIAFSITAIHDRLAPHSDCEHCPVGTAAAVTCSSTALLSCPITSGCNCALGARCKQHHHVRSGAIDHSNLQEASAQIANGKEPQCLWLHYRAVADLAMAKSRSACGCTTVR